MAYSICGLIIPQREEPFCSENKWPYVRLEESLSLMPLERDYLLLTDGDDTEPREDFDFTPPSWLLEIANHFSKSAYIEAEIFGGMGVQASMVMERGKIVFGPMIASHAINPALRQMGVKDNGMSATLFGVPVMTDPGDKDAFDIVGLGRHRSVSGWLQESAEKPPGLGGRHQGN